MNRKILYGALELFCVLALIAGVALYFKYRRDKENEAQISRQNAEQLQQKQKVDTEKAKQQQIVKAESEHVQFVNQYVDNHIARTPGIPLIAVAVADESKSMNHAMGVALMNRFKGEHAEFTDSFFKPPLVTDGLFNDVFNGSTALLTKLEVTNSVDGLLLARQSVQYSTNADLAGVIIANMSLEVVNLTVAGQFQSQSWTFTANGTGFHRTDARMQAEERIIKQISDRQDMSLSLINTNH